MPVIKMDIYEKPCDDELFIIDSNNLNQITTSFYGYVINEDGFVNTDVNEKEQLTHDGAYIFVDVSDEKIAIYQDFIGSYGLYLFQSDDYFALSNSFVKLVDHIKSGHEISLNMDYANDFIFASLTTHSYGKTLVNEIEFLPRDIIINIDKATNNLEFEEINYNEHSIRLNSTQGIEILDKWYCKWVNIMRSIKARTNNFCVHLSGGFDSRVVAALWLSANINLDDVKVISIDDGKHTHSEDYEISSQIADHFNFELNKGKVNESKICCEDIETPLMNSFNVKLGFHKEMYFKPFKYKEPVYTFTGSGGELVRGFYNASPSEFLDVFFKRISNKDYTLIRSSLNIFNSSFADIASKYNYDVDSIDLDDYYLDVRCRHHFGKGSVETFLSNEISLNPLIDSGLCRLILNDEECIDKQLLISLIFVRYCPDLLDFKFEGGRGIDSKTIDYARKINDEYPFAHEEFEDIGTPESDVNSDNANQDNCIKRKDIDGFLENMFDSRAFEMEFKKYFSFKTYDEIYNIAKNTDYYPLKSVYSAIAVLRIANDVELSRANDKKDDMFWFNSFFNEDYIEDVMIHKNKADLIKYATARMDFRTIGNNKIEILENSDDYSLQFSPDWGNSKTGKRYIIESYNGSIDLKIRCIGSGKLELSLRSFDYRDKYGTFPIYINFRNLQVNGERYIYNKTITHTEKYLFEKDVEDGEILEIHIDWTPLNESSVCVNKLQLVNDILTERNEELTLKLKNLTLEYEKLKSENENFKNGKN